MNPQLVEAIRQLNLKPGESYTVEVDGRTVEIRDRDPSGGSIVLRQGPLPLPDPPIIPPEYEGFP